jgi:class 3 adenylate cyclase
VRTDAAYDLGAEAGQHYVEFVTGDAADVWTDRQLAVVVFADIVGSTAEVSRVGDRAWRNTLDDADETVVREVARFGGRVVKQTGDGYLLTFTSPGAAISAVFSMRRAAHVFGLSQRFGIHMGEIETRADGDVAGITVHTASRIADRASGDEILVSRVINDLLAGTGLELVDRGSHELKGLPAPVQVFAVVA